LWLALASADPALDVREQLVKRLLGHWRERRIENW
jgi:hypothetical protein